MEQGLFIVLEGSSAQFKLLGERLAAVGYEVEQVKFPRSDHESSHFIRRYESGSYGPRNKVSPYTASLFYALDRYEAAGKIRSSLRENKIVLASSYVGSTMAEQGSKIQDPIEQRSFFVWADSLEYQLLDIPRPKMNFFISAEGRSTVDLLCRLFPQDFKLVTGRADGELQEIAAVNNQIWEMIKPLLPPKPQKAGHDRTVRLNEEKAAKQPVPAAAPPVTLHPEIEFDTDASLLVLSELETLAPGSVKYSLNWQQADYKAFVPMGMAKKMESKYQEVIKEIADLHKDMRAKLKAHGGNYKLLDAALPMAALFNAHIKLSGEQASAVVGDFTSGRQGEKQALAERIQDAAEQAGIKLGDRAEPERIDDIIARLAAEKLPQTLPPQSEPVVLAEAIPRNEFKVLIESLYPYSSLPRDELARQIDSWNYQQKEEALVKALAAGNSRLKKDITYRFDITADQQLIPRLRSRAKDIEITPQPLTPRYGYDVPEELSQAEISDQFIECFDKSLELYSSLQAAGKDEFTPYAVLLGHKQRLQLTCSLQSILEWRQITDDSELAVLASQMVEKVAEVHPVIGDTISKLTEKKSVSAAPKAGGKRKSRRRGSRKKS